MKYQGFLRSDTDLALWTHYLEAEFKCIGLTRRWIIMVKKSSGYTLHKNWADTLWTPPHKVTMFLYWIAMMELALQKSLWLCRSGRNSTKARKQRQNGTDWKAATWKSPCSWCRKLDGKGTLSLRAGWISSCHRLEWTWVMIFPQVD